MSRNGTASQYRSTIEKRSTARKYPASRSSPMSEKFADARYFLLRHSPDSPSIRYLGVRVNSVERPTSASSTARTLFTESPIPSDRRNGTYFSAGFQLLPISLCDDT